MPKSLILIILILALTASAAYAGWGENIRLSYDGTQTFPRVIARNDTVHVVSEQYMGGSISYLRSVDGGASWDSVVILNQAGHSCSDATLNLAENGLLISWRDYYINQNESSIGISKSIDGFSWSRPTYVWTDNINHFGWPTSAISGDSIFLIYSSQRNDSTGRRPLRSMHSYDYGRIWSDEVTVGYPFILSPQPIRLKYCSGTLLAAWSGTADSSRRNEVHVYGYRSSDAGETWSDAIWISPDSPNWSLDVCLACNQTTGQLVAGYMDYRFIQYAFHGDIFAAISNDGGVTWPFETMLSTHHTAWFPQIDFVQDTLMAVWPDMQFDVGGQHEIIFNRSNDAGRTWEGEYRLTMTEEESGAPWISYDNGHIYIVWGEDIPHHGTDIFYKRYIPDPSSADGQDISNPSAISFSAYPNPFNSSTIISYSDLEGGEVSIYNIHGQLIGAFVLEGKEGQIKWDARDAMGNKVSSGIYFARAKSSSSSKAIKLIYLK